MAAQYGPHRFSAGNYDSDHTDAYRGASLEVRDLTGARLVDCDLTRVKVVDGWLVDVSMSGYVSNLRVNDVDVTAFVEAELDRRYPERVQLRELGTADGFRAMWATIERLWAGAVARAERLPEPARHERVDGEWSFIETLRHLVWITDSWASRTVLDQELPYHALALPQAWYPAAEAAALGMDLAARPSFAEVMEVRAGRMALMRDLVGGLADSDLGRLSTRSPAPGYSDEPEPAGGCLGVVMEEEIEHYRFAVRDLSVLEAR
jgi:hypothetical protein